MPARPIDPKRFPALAEYLERLPAGLLSYPEATSKGILLRSSMASHYVHRTWKDLPPAIVSAVRSPPAVTGWVSTVLTDAVFCLVADTFYPTPEAMLKWNYDRTLRMAKVPMYSAIAGVVGLERFLKGAARVHALFQRGTDVSVEVRGAGADVFLRHVPHLHGTLNHLSNEGVFRAALESAGGLDVTVKMLESTPTLARYEARWRP